LGPNNPKIEPSGTLTDTLFRAVYAPKCLLTDSIESKLFIKNGLYLNIILKAIYGNFAPKI